MMKYFLSLLVAMFVMSAGAAEPAPGPATMVNAFIADYAAWNLRAYKRSGSDAMRVAEREYGQLIAKFCRPGFKPQPISYGDDSMHEPEHEVITSTKLLGRTALVHTKLTKKDDFGLQVSEYEYRLTSDGLRWFLESVKYVDADGKYEGL